MATEVYFSTIELFRDATFYDRKDESIFGPIAARKAFETGGYFKVAEYPDDATLETIWRQTQNIEDAWCDPPQRSMCVGDIVKKGDELYIVARFGFDKL